MIPLHFGAPGDRLFGVYHPASAAPARRTGVVVCAPFGHEYIRAHRALRQLALRLADHGFHVLRFDYHGCGDSDGEGTAGTVARWLADIDAAVEELKATADVRRVCLLGLRLGATMAAVAATRRRDVEAAVLWDAVPDGRAYLDELRDVQRRWLRGRPGSPWFAWRREPDEIIGFPVPATLRASIAGLQLPPTGGGGRRLHVAEPEADWTIPDRVHAPLLSTLGVEQVARAVVEQVP